MSHVSINPFFPLNRLGNREASRGAEQLVTSGSSALDYTFCSTNNLHWPAEARMRRVPENVIPFGKAMNCVLKHWRPPSMHKCNIGSGQLGLSVFQCSLQTIEVIHVLSKVSLSTQRYAWNFGQSLKQPVYIAQGRKYHIFWDQWKIQETNDPCCLLIESTQLLPETLCIPFSLIYRSFTTLFPWHRGTASKSVQTTNCAENAEVDADDVCCFADTKADHGVT